MSILDTIMGKSAQQKPQEAPVAQPAADTAPVATETPVNPLSQFNDMAQAAQTC